jgi:copper chaperone CopZ
VSVAIKKVEGIDDVNVSLNEGNASIKLKPGNTVTVEQVREIVRKNGFTPKDATAKVAGTIIERDGKAALQVNGSDSVMLLTGHERELAGLKGKKVLASVTFPETTSAQNKPSSVKVEAVSAAP